MVAEPQLNERYRAGDLPPGSVVRHIQSEYVIARTGLCMAWEQPIPGSENWLVVYTGRLPDHGHEESPGDEGRWMTPRERAQVDEAREKALVRKFAYGDHVRIIDPKSMWYGMTGVIVRVPGEDVGFGPSSTYAMTLDGREGRFAPFTDDQLDMVC